MGNDNSIYDSERYKCKIKAIIQNKGLCSIMNNTKWRELKKEIAELPFLPPFVIKSVDFFCYVRRSQCMVLKKHSNIKIFDLLGKKYYN